VLALMQAIMVGVAARALIQLKRAAIAVVSASR
jgi:hypothetical protein